MDLLGSAMNPIFLGFVQEFIQKGLVHSGLTRFVRKVSSTLQIFRLGPRKALKCLKIKSKVDNSEVWKYILISLGWILNVHMLATSPSLSAMPFRTESNSLYSLDCRKLRKPGGSPRCNVSRTYDEIMWKIMWKSSDSPMPDHGICQMSLSSAYQSQLRLSSVELPQREWLSVHHPRLGAIHSCHPLSNVSPINGTTMGPWCGDGDVSNVTWRFRNWHLVDRVKVQRL